MSTPIRTVTFSATPSGVTPDQPQFAGVQGDHNATSVVFALDEALVNAAYQYRFEFVDGAGGYDTTDFVALENSQASCLLPGNWTGAGSTGTIRLCAVILGADNTEEQVVYTLSGRLKFAPRDTGTPMETEYEKGLSGLIADTKDAADAANQAAADAEAKNANTAASGANQAKSQAEAAATRAEQKSDEANTAAANANTAASTANQAAANAETAADTAQTVADTVQQKLDNGEFIGPPGPQGKKGNPGEDFRVLGYYDTLALLQAAVPSPTAGDVYGVGTSAPYTIYIFDAVGGTWVDNGTIQGPQGEAGADGAPGPNEVSTNTATNITGLLKGNGANVLAAEAGVDFATAGIAESGGSASTGYWVKYDDGTMIWTATRTMSVEPFSASGSLYISSFIDLGTFPESFYGTPFVKAEQQYEPTKWTTSVTNTSSTSVGKVAVLSALATTNGTPLSIKCFAIGRWK